MVIKKFQNGGSVDPNATPQGGQEQGGGQGSPEEQIMGMAAQIVQQLGPDRASMLAQAIMQILQQAQGQQAQPTYQRKGGKLVRI